MTFFVFADTISARNFAGTNECHGWLGIRFQATPGGEPNHVLLHLNLMDDTNLLQQQAVGVFGVNLIPTAADDFRSATEGTAIESWIDSASSIATIDAHCLHSPRPLSHLSSYLVETGFLRAIAP